MSLVLQEPVANITYYFYDLASLTLIADLPLHGVTWSQSLNDVGTFSGSLNLNSPKVTALDWVDATQPARHALFIDVNGQIAWGGVVWARKYTRSTGSLTLTGSDFFSYLRRRVQAADYTTTWATGTSDPILVAAKLVVDMQAVTGSGLTWMNVGFHGSVPSANRAPLVFPYTQLQMVGNLIGQMAKMSYGFGFDFGIDCDWLDGPGGIPSVTLNLSYPNRGAAYPASGLVLDAGPEVIDFEWPEDATANANRVFESATTSGGVVITAQSAAALSATPPYPLLDAVISNPSVNSTPVSQTQLQAYADDDLTWGTYEATPGSVKLPMVSNANPWITAFSTGDQMLVTIPPASPTWRDPRFPNGMAQTMRVVKVAASAADEGLSTMDLTFNLPSTTTAVVPPA